MRFRRPASLLFAVLSAMIATAATSAARADATCEGVRCSGHGTCFEENDALHCLCDAGYAEIGQECVVNNSEDRVARARRSPEAIGRVLEVALAEVGHERWQVGRALTEFPGPLTDYLAPFEWWCGDFVSWVYAAAGVPLSGGSNGGWLITDNRAIAAWHEQRDLWYDHDHPEWDTFVPQGGDFLRMRTDRYGHAAIVIEVIGTTVWVVEGNVMGAVERTPYYHFRRNRLIDGFGRMAMPDTLPVLDAGADFVAVRDEPVTLAAQATDDGPRERLVFEWTGPESVAFEDASSPDTSVVFRETGEFELQLRVRDREDEHVIDAVRVLVFEPPPPPPEPAAATAPPTRTDALDPTASALPLALAGLAFLGLLGAGLFLRSRR